MPSHERKPRVLMAVSERAAQRMLRVLSGWEVASAASLPQFVHALRCCEHDLVIVGCHFDGSRALEALKSATAHAPRVPLACVLAAPFSSHLGEGTVAAFHAAAEELGVDCFIDVLQFPDDEAGNARVHAMLERLLFVT
jgi:hypothetical protein